MFGFGIFCLFFCPVCWGFVCNVLTPNCLPPPSPASHPLFPRAQRLIHSWWISRTFSFLWNTIFVLCHAVSGTPSPHDIAVEVTLHWEPLGTNCSTFWIIDTQLLPMCDGCGYPNERDNLLTQCAIQSRVYEYVVISVCRPFS